MSEFFASMCGALGEGAKLILLCVLLGLPVFLLTLLIDWMFFQ